MGLVAKTKQLIDLGLTSDEARVYLALLERGSLGASALGGTLGILPNAVYRLAKRLEQKGFVVALQVFPVRFQAIPAFLALDTFTNKQQQRLEELKRQIISRLAGTTATSPQTKVEVLTGQVEFFTKFVELAKQASKEILVISIGEPVPDEIKVACARALQRKVVLNFIFHRFDKTNEQLIKSWIKMGVTVKHYQDWGYHLNVIDGKVSVLVTNNPSGTQERTGLVLYNEALSKALREFFYSIWDKATSIQA